MNWIIIWEDITMSEIYSWVKNIIIFLILTTIITNLLGKSTYKKYVDLITGIILVILVISPLLKLFHLQETLDYYFSANFLMAEAEDINIKFKDVEEGQMNVIFSEYKQEIKKQVSNLLEKENLYVVNFEIIIDDNAASNTFGVLKSMNIVASYDKEDAKVESKTISKIEIEPIEIGKKTSSKTGLDRKYLSPEEINVKNLLSDFYNINPDNINISIQER